MTATWIHSAKQDRSRSTKRRILRAAARLLRARPLDQVSVTQIVQAAGVSVGGYYARFPSKSSLLSALYDECIQKATRAISDVLREDRWDKRPIREIIRAYLESAMRFFTRHRVIVSQVITNARENRNSPLGRAVAEFNNFAHGKLVELLVARSNEICHENPQEAATLAIRVTSAALRDFVLFGARRVAYGSAEANDLLDQLTRMFVAYLESTS